MLSGYRNKLKEIRKKAVSAKTLNSYVAVLSDMFLENMELFTKTCDELGMKEDELLDILNNASLSNIGLLDEMIQININHLKKGIDKNKISR